MCCLNNSNYAPVIKYTYIQNMVIPDELGWAVSLDKHVMFFSIFPDFSHSSTFCGLPVLSPVHVDPCGFKYLGSLASGCVLHRIRIKFNICVIVFKDVQSYTTYVDETWWNRLMFFMHNFEADVWNKNISFKYFIIIMLATYF